MRFEHLVEVNDPLMPLLTELSREQLWRGLVLRAEDPTQFIAGLVSATIVSRNESDGVVVYRRLLDFGSFRVDDSVRLFPGLRTEIATQPGPTWPASRMTITIEEPEPQRLFLRFVYEDDDGRASNEIEAMALDLRNQAYQSADLDTIVRIRDLAEAGALD